MSLLLRQESEREPLWPRLLAGAARAGRLAALPLVFVAASVLLTKLAFTSLLIPFGILYVVGFSLTAWHFPGVALMLVFASAPFQNDLSGGGGAKFSIAEINLLLTLPALYLRCLTQKLRLHTGPILVPVLLYFAVCLCSSSLHWLGQTAVLSLVQMFLYFVVVVAVFCALPTDPRQYWVGFHVLVAVGVFLAIAGLATDYWFIGLNKNGIAASLAGCFLVTTELILSAPSRKRRVLLLAAMSVVTVGLLFSLSRGAWLGTLSGVCFIFFLRRQLPLLLKISLCLLPLLVVFWLTLPQSSRDYAGGFGQEHYNIQLRYQSIDLAENYFDQSPVYGMGVGLRKNYDATNVVLLTLAETGVLGVLGLLLIHFAYFGMIWRAQKRIARPEALFSLLCIGGALVLDKFVHGLVDQYWSRGEIMVAWASAGMATRVYYIAQGRARTEAAEVGAGEPAWDSLVMRPEP